MARTRKTAEAAGAPGSEDTKKPAEPTTAAPAEQKSTNDPEKIISMLSVDGAASDPRLERIRQQAEEVRRAQNPSTRYRPIDYIRAAFSNAKRPIVIPEWGHPETGEALTLYFEPLTLADLEWVQMGAPDTESMHARNVRLLVHKAKIQDSLSGAYVPAFVNGDGPLLMREAYYSVVQRVTAHMYEVNVTPTEAEKELNNPQTDGSAS
jgi:hypothetical protein